MKKKVNEFVIPSLTAMTLSDNVRVLDEGDGTNISVIPIHKAKATIEVGLSRVEYLVNENYKRAGYAWTHAIPDLIHQIGLLVYDSTVYEVINKYRAMVYIRMLSIYLDKCNEMAEGNTDKLEVSLSYNPLNPDMAKEMEEDQEQRLSLLDKLTDPYKDDDTGEVNLNPHELARILRNQDKELTDRLMTIFNYYHDRLFREIKIECQNSLGNTPDFKQVWGSMVFYIQQDMNFPDTVSVEDFIECMTWSLRGQDEDIPEEG